jgi:hypothetical protein
MRGSGNILRQMPADRRIGYDINPQDNGEFGIIQADYRQQLLDPLRKWVVLTNPAFARQPGDKEGGPQTLYAWAASQFCVVAHRDHHAPFVPKSQDREQAEPIFSPHPHRGPGTRIVHAQRAGQWSPAIFTFWVRRNFMRDQIVIRDTHPDWEWLPARRNLEADAWMQMWGVGVGDIKPPDNLGKTNDWSLHVYVKEIRPGTIERLKRFNWREVTYLTLSSPRRHKDEIVGAYIAAYGDPEAPDYNPEDGGAGKNVAAPKAPAPTLPAAPPSSESFTAPDDLEWLTRRRGIGEATLWIGWRGPHAGKLLDGAKQVPQIPADFYALRCDAPTEAIMRSIRWRGVVSSPGGTLSKQTISLE